MLGTYENFPANIHLVETFASPLSSRKLQERLIQVLREVNRKTFSFDQVAQPALHDCTVILEAGIAEGADFSFIDDEETKKALSLLRKASFDRMDLFCAVRYYKGTAEKKKPLKFDYYMLRAVFGEGSMELQVFHERGPRYLSPEDLVAFLVREVNSTSARRILRTVESSQ
ncbi:hypothetical protein G4O51_10570 [Candidatus Bathyarchaeota archaeon A05DMB-2]|jgi:hypothetical protein|nr:hypothetical protein [Candidatus Bathyarchaeota archaeon A05DMB-2]